MEIYARQGFTDFVLAAGYRADLIGAFAAELPDAWTVEVVDTGEDTGTGGPDHRRAPARSGRPSWPPTATAWARCDLAALLAFHRGHAGAVTVTGGAPALPLRHDRVGRDRAGRTLRGEAAAGRPLDQRRLLRHRRTGPSTTGSGDDLEREVLPALAAAGELYVYRHIGLLAVDGHLQGRPGAQRPVRGRRWPVDDLAGARVLVTGATGFIGSHLCRRLLADGAEVHALTSTVSSVYPVRLVDIRDRITLHGGNLNDGGAMDVAWSSRPTRRRLPPGAYTHVGKSWERVDECIQTNVHGTVNLLQALARSNYQRFVYTSTSEVYGDVPVPFREDAAGRPALALLGEQVRR